MYVLDAGGDDGAHSQTGDGSVQREWHKVGVSLAGHLGAEIGVHGEVLDLHTNFAALYGLGEILTDLLEVAGLRLSLGMAYEVDDLTRRHDTEWVAPTRLRFYPPRSGKFRVQLNLSPNRITCIVISRYLSKVYGQTSSC